MDESGDAEVIFGDLSEVPISDHFSYLKGLIDYEGAIKPN